MSIIKTHNGWVQLEPSDYTIAVDNLQGETEEKHRSEMDASADRYHNSIWAYLNGTYGGNSGLQEMYADSRWNEKAKSPFSNPSKAWVNRYAT